MFRIFSQKVDQKLLLPQPKPIIEIGIVWLCQSQIGVVFRQGFQSLGLKSEKKRSKNRKKALLLQIFFLAEIQSDKGASL